MFRPVRIATEPVKLLRINVPDCGGTGYIRNKKTIEVSIPAGIDDGQSVRIRGKGEPGIQWRSPRRSACQCQRGPSSDLPPSGI
ncbi:MAG: DnaJ C-terminal domain-containing protein [Frisingicoccus sp.]